VLREPSSICLAISRGSIQGIELASSSVIEKAVAAYREEIRQNRQGVQIAHALYNLLLEPIPGLDQKLRITIVPDGFLHLLPFDAILTPSGRFLLDSHLIDYSPSSTVMLLLRKLAANRRSSGRFLGVGDARLSSADELGSVFANITHPGQLPGSRAEVLSIVKELKNEFEIVTLLDAEANETGIKNQDLSGFDILHFAVHGTSDTDFPARSALLLGPRSDEAEDGILQAWEISRLRLKADLVVLSACDTAVGKLLDQVGVSNLVHSFLLAGARAVVASIWPMEDRPTADLMIRFYSYLVQGMDKGSALRQAKLDFIAKYKDKALPVHWAGMLMIGDSSDSILGKHQVNIARDEVR
jgi:CHAT domain-containing protein